MADAQTEFDLDALENAIEAGIKAQFPALQTVEFDRLDRKNLALPACLLECEEFDSDGVEPDPGSGQLAAFGKYSARIVLGFRTDKARRETRKLATKLTAFLRLRRWRGGVTSVAIVAGGSGYTSAPVVSFTGDEGAGAKATAVLGTGPTAGQVVAVNVTNGGGSYTSAPTVAFSGGGGTGATATSSIKNIASGPAVVTSCAPDHFDPDLDQFEVWRVEWAHIVHIGESVWAPDPDAVTPTTVYSRATNPEGGELDETPLKLTP